MTDISADGAFPALLWALLELHRLHVGLDVCKPLRGGALAGAPHTQRSSFEASHGLRLKGGEAAEKQRAGEEERVRGEADLDVP